MQRAQYATQMPSVVVLCPKSRKTRHLQVLLLLLSALFAQVALGAAEVWGQHRRPEQLHPLWDAKLSRRLRVTAGTRSYPNITADYTHARRHPKPAWAVKHADGHNSKASMHQGLLSWATGPIRQLLALSSTSSSNSTDSSAVNSTNGSSTNSATKASLNPWYDQHLLSSAAGWASGLLYGSINSSSKVPLDAEGTGDVAASEDTPHAAADPPPYEYPPVGRHPTVFFTALLHNFVGAGGLQPREQVAFSSAINAFLAPSASSVITNTTIITQALASSGLWLPCATAFFTADSATLQDYLATTLQSDPNLILPTATWGLVRTANIKIAQPAAPASITYNWIVGEYTNCSVMCGGGVQQRQVSCLDNYANVADPSMCTPPMPASSRSCQTQPCQASLPSSFMLVLGPWGPCNSTCSYGSRTRTATCVSKEGYIGSLSNCNTTPEELSQQLWQPCMLPPCPTFIWSYSDWICDNTAGCGGGTASRNITCIMASSDEVVDANLCDAAKRDNSTQPCAQGPCITFYWRARELADCLPEEASKPCGRYLQRRGFDCVNMTSGEVVTNNYCSGPKPVLGEVECMRPSGVDCTAGITVPPAPAVTPPIAGAPPDISTAAQPEANTTNGNTGSSSAGTPGGSGEVVSPGSPAPTGTAHVPTASAASAPGSQVGISSSSTGSSSGFDSGLGGSITAAEAVTSDSNAPDSSTTAAVGAQHLGASSSSTVYNNLTGSWPGQAGSTVASSGGSGSGLTAGSSTEGLPMDIGNSSSPAAGQSGTGSISLGSAASTDTTTTSVGNVLAGNSGGGGGGGGSSSIAPGADLGPGASLPAWLLNDPTPALKALLECQGGYALSADGVCCSGALIDAKGSCCETGIVDACGFCNGTGKAVDSLGACCAGVLDAQGICCTGVVDECGVCNGTNACDLKVELLAAISPAVLFLRPASEANRRLRAALQEDVAAALSIATGRAVELSRVFVTLSSYSGQSGSGKTKAVGTDGAISVSEGWDDSHASDTDTAGSYAIPPNTIGPTFIGAPVAALPARGDSGKGSMPVQMDAIMQAPEQLDAPATHANLAAQRPPTSGNLELQRQQGVIERARKAGAVSIAASAAAQQVSSHDNSEANAVGLVGVVRHLQDAVASVRRQLLELHPGRALAQELSSFGDEELNFSNAVWVSILLKAPTSGSGTDTGSTLLALKSLVGTQLSITGNKNRLTYKEVTSVVRAGTCGDGICQVNERLSWNNPDSCPADCALPFLSCPPFDTDGLPCNGRGVCYNSIGSCACTKGYAGSDCSSCAVGFKRVNGFCVSATALVPQRLCGSEVCIGNLTDGSSLAVIPPGRSMAAGQAAVIAVVLSSMLLVASAAVVVYRKRWSDLMAAHSAAVKVGMDVPAE